MFFSDEASSAAVLGDFDSALEKLVQTESGPESAEELKILLAEVRGVLKQRLNDHDRLLRLKRDKARLRGVIKGQRQELDSTKCELKKVKKKLGSANKKVSTLNAKCAFLEADIDALEARCSMLESDVQSLREECDMLKKELKHLKATRPETYKALKVDAQGVWSYYCKWGTRML